MDPVLVITHHDAGPDDAEALATALAVLREHCSVEVQATGHPGELDSALHRAASRRIVVAGGDGSMHAVIGALHRRHDLKRAVVGLLPLGTGNDFARTVGIPLDVADAARVVVAGATRRMDLLVDELGEVVVNNVHAGVGAEASRRGAVWKRRLHAVGVGAANLGRLGYPVGALVAAVDPPFIRVCVEVDGEVVVDLDQPVVMVAVGNGAHVGGGTALVPHADPDDGLADVLVSRAVRPWAKLGSALALLQGTHAERDDVTYVRGSSVTVSGGGFWCSADGEVYGPERHRSWHVESAAYSLVVPPPG